MHISSSKKVRKWLVGAGLSMIIGIQLLVALVPTQTKAIVGAPDVVAALSGKWSNDAVLEGLLASSLGSLVNGFSYFMQKLAYDSASWLASSAVGQKPLVFQEGGEAYFKNVALDSAATAIEQFGAPFGLNLCKPPDIKFQIFLQVSLRKMYEDPSLAGGPQPTCRWNDFRTSWENGFENFDEKAGDFASQMFAKSLKVDQSDMGVALGMVSKVDRINANAQAGANTDRLEGGGFKAVTDLISGKIKTPSQVIAEETKALTGSKQQQLTSQQVAGIYGAGLWQVIPAAAGVFLNTFVSQLTDKVFNGFFETDDSVSAPGVASVFSEYAGVINNNRAAAQNAFGFLFTTVPTQQLTTYPLMEEFSDCSNPENPGLNNCVADPGLVLAVKQAGTGKPLTIREAMDPKNNFLHAKWSLIPPQHEFNSDPKKCFNNGYYCFSNIQKLRKARILPLGFEIAASKVDPDSIQNYTLEAVVNGYYDCNASGQSDAQHPFCHLIDPEWIVRLPEPRCEAKVFGPRLLANDNAERRLECVDVSTCLLEDDRGRCIGGYGYCLREKNTWRFGGSSCPQQFNTCATYTNNRDNTKVSYLSRTIQTGQCNAQSVGCQIYSVAPLAGGGWKTDPLVTDYKQEALGKKPTIYFNESIKKETCPSSAEGCSALVKVDSDGNRGETTYLKKAPASLFSACYLVPNPGVNGGTRWPETAGEIATLSKRPEAQLCAPFAPACTKNDVGCEAYTPDNSADKVYGIVGSNRCAASCVGYDTFKQEQPEDRGAFEPEVFPLHFIPTEPAKKCSLVHEGCSEFTNIDAASSGGETLEYYSDIAYCERPTATNQKTFYSWEGKANEGYVLRTHKLRPVSAEQNDRYSANFIAAIGGGTLGALFPAGSPAYADFDPAVMQELVSECNKTAYDAAVTNPYGINTAKPGCVALYDDTEAVFYRMIDKVVNVSAACHPLRKTESFLRQDTYLTSLGQESACTAKGGRWANNSCELCYNGGIYQNGACVYWTTSVAGDDKSCPAAANNCRAYTGKDANNTLTFVDQKFEPGNGVDGLVNAKQGWGAGTNIRPESLIGSQNSLEISETVTDYTFAENSLETNKSYELEFWSRGAQVNLEIEFYNVTTGQSVGSFTINPSTGESVKVPISSTWQAYRLGPVQFTGVGTDKIALRFTRSVVSGTAAPYNYFIDNFKVIRITGKIPLIKNSWKQAVTAPDGSVVLADAPLACDADPKDGLPGGALGCRAYTDSLGAKVPATGFDRLCRPEAVGCTAFVDTQNTINEIQATAYNLKCKGTQNQECKIVVNNTTDLGTCQVPAGETFCYVKKTVLPATITPTNATAPENTLEWLKSKGHFAASTIVVPADTPAAEPIYLANRKTYACNQANPSDSAQYLGCQKIALQELKVPGNPLAGYSYSETFVKNNPDNYSQILCSSDQIGCGEFKSGNTMSYFKDPVKAGAPICSYKDAVKVGQNNISGWFQEGIGNCSGNSALSCKQDADCTIANAGTCQNIGSIPCYSNFAVAGGSYGIWSNQSAQYNGSVGRCPDQYNQCMEIVDPIDTSAEYPAGKPYHVILDQRLQNTAGDCDGKVNLKNGCALFNVTSNPTKIFNAVETYKVSDGYTTNQAKYNPTEPNTTAKPFDANILLKVSRDRSCSEWLSCKDKTRVTDQNGKERTICTQYKACRSTVTGETCEDWSEDTAESVALLNEAAYTKRDVSWFGEDYSGYSLFNKFQVSNMVSLVFEDNPIAYLGYRHVTTGSQAAGNTCTNEWDVCGPNNAGRCYEKKCILPISGAFPGGEGKNAESMAKFLEGGICKAYPEKTAPFASTIGTQANTVKSAYTGGPTRYEYTAKLSGLEGANICQSGECSCEYQKVTYKSGTVDYYQFPDQRYPAGVCSGGDRDGQTCVADLDCTVTKDGSVISAGVCSQIKDIQTQIGLRGFCLEYDYSRPINRARNEYACLTWLPVDTAATNYDSFNRFSEAGYYPAIDGATKTANNQTAFGGQVYCTESSANWTGTYDKDQLIGIDGGFAEPKNNLKIVPNTFSKWLNWDNGYALAGYKNNHKPANATQEVSEDTFKKLQYSTMQAFAWRGDAYVFNNHPKNYDNFGTADGAQQGFNVPNAVVTFTSALPYHYYLSPSNFGFNFLAELVNIPGQFGSGPYVPNFRLPLTILEPEIGVQHFGPMLSPGSKPYMMTINNEFLRKSVKTKESAGTVSYSYAVDSKIIENNTTADTTGSVYVNPGQFNLATIGFRVTMDSGPDLGKVLVGSIALMDSDSSLEIPDIKSFGKEAISDFMSTEPITDTPLAGAMPKVSDWRNKDSPHRSVMLIYTVYGADGKKIGAVRQSTNYSAQNLVDMKKILGSHDGEFVTPYLAEIVELLPRCVQFTQVYDATQEVNKNKAWTNRTWYYAKELSPNRPYGAIKVYRPYGSTLLDAGLYMQFNGGWENNLRRYIFLQPDEQGMFMSCKNELDFLDTNGTINYGQIYAPPYFGVVANYGNSRCKYSSVEYQGQLKNDYDDLEPASMPVVSTLPPMSGDKMLSEIFVKTYKQTSFSNTTSLKWRVDQDGEDKSGEYRAGLIVPQIYSLDVSRCFTGAKNNAQNCAPKEMNAFTINRRNATPDEDVKQDGVYNLIVKENSLTAVTNFFAFADHNRMPIKRIMIDWGDNSTVTNASRYGDYKNRKPYCMSPSEESAQSTALKQCSNNPQLTCKSNQDCPNGGTCNVEGFAFGNAARACTPDYFEFTHSYSCGELDKTNKESFVYDFEQNSNVNGANPLPAGEGTKIWAHLKSLNYNKDNTKFVCIFKPMVQVMDNWGWCTGQCTNHNKDGVTDYNDGCYAYGKGSGATDQCNYIKDNVNYSKMFIPYKGYIVVTP